jgi:hypothetical protein
MSSRTPKDPSGARELTAIVAGGLLVVVCCAGPALLAAGVVGALGGVLRSPILVGIAVLALALALGAVARRLGGNDRVERGRELPVPIADQEPELPDAVFEAHEQVAGLLRHPLSQWTRCHTEHVDPAGADLDHEQHLQPLEEHGVDGEQVHRQHTLGLRPQELPPWDGRPLRRWVNTSSLEDGPCGAGPDPGAESAQLSVDAAVAPGRVLPGQPQHQQRGSLGRYSDGHAGADGFSGVGSGLDASAAVFLAGQAARARPGGEAGARAQQPPPGRPS